MPPFDLLFFLPAWAVDAGLTAINVFGMVNLLAEAGNPHTRISSANAKLAIALWVVYALIVYHEGHYATAATSLLAAGLWVFILHYRRAKARRGEVPILADAHRGVRAIVGLLGR